MAVNTELLAGRNSVREALLAKRRRISRVMMAEGVTPQEIVLEITRLCQENNIALKMMPRDVLDRMSPEVRHQGVLAEVSLYPFVGIEQIVPRSKSDGQMPFLLILDNLQDPQNVGALLRTAEAVGVDGVVVMSQRASGITPAVSRASAGAVEHLAIAQQTNLAQTVRWLKERGIWIIGVEETETSQDYRIQRYDMPLALIVGSEGGGLRRLTVRECDIVVSIPMVGRIHSLNAAIAGSLALYQVYNDRGKR